MCRSFRLKNPLASEPLVLARRQHLQIIQGYTSMDSSGFMALFLAGTDDTATSALPNAPRVHRKTKLELSRWSAMRGRIASLLHRLAWAIEPDTHRIR